MTKASLKRLVADLQSMLRLDHWEIEVSDDLCTDPHSDARVWIPADYCRATIYMDDDWKSWPDKRVVHVMAHELVHILHRDVDQVLTLVECATSSETFKLIDRSYTHALETFVDQIAKAIAESVDESS